eukprot:scaffold7873_cov449-Pinguiococcus_pyrenoidosus.AAC.1
MWIEEGIGSGGMKRRFKQVWACLHISDPTKSTHDPLQKVRLLLDHLMDVFPKAYQPGRDLSGDEITIGFQGRCAKLKSRIDYKKEGDGFLVESIADPRNGYL